MLPGKDIIIGNLRIKYYQSSIIDKNNVLVFLHGWGSQATHFQKTLEKCQSFVAIDLPGFGDSEIPQTPWIIEDYANFIKALLQKLDIHNPILAGHSFGGSIAIKYCASGYTAKKLILIGSAGLRQKSAKKYFYFVVAKVFGLFFSLPGIGGLKNIVRKWFYKKIDATDYIQAGALREIYLNTISEDLTGDLQKISVPTTLIWGAQDTDTPIENGEIMQHLIPNSQLYIIPDAGHYIFLDNQIEFEKIFLNPMR